MVIGNRIFLDDNKTYIMGILNVTPDSFSDGGRYTDIDLALKHVEQMINDGADIIDVGGESTRPGYTPVGDCEELRRVIPVIGRIKEEFDIPVSIDTYHSNVAKEAVLAGADLVNDVWGLAYEGNTIPMADVVRETGASVCIMHNSNRRVTVATEGNIPDEKQIENGIDVIIKDIEKSLELASNVGIDRDKIMIDPGVGFAKDYHMNMATIANLKRFNELGYPVLLGTSGKSVIGITLDIPVDERLEGTIATSVLAVMSGCSYVRVHNVKSNKRAITMTEELLKYLI